MLFELECGPLHITFPAASGGLPGRVTVIEGDGRETLLFDNSGWQLEAELENGIILHPVATGKELTQMRKKFKKWVDKPRGSVYNVMSIFMLGGILLWESLIRRKKSLMNLLLKTT